VAGLSTPEVKRQFFATPSSNGYEEPEAEAFSTTCINLTVRCNCYHYGDSVLLIEMPHILYPFYLANAALKMKTFNNLLDEYSDNLAEATHNSQIVDAH